MIESLQGTLREFDKAFEKMYHSKADAIELQRVEQDFEPSRAIHVLNDMQLLFDKTVEQIRKENEDERANF